MMDIDIVSFALGSIVTCLFFLVFLTVSYVSYRCPSMWFGFASRKKKREILMNMYEEEFGEEDSK